MITIQFNSVDAGYLPGEDISGQIAWKDLPVDCERLEIRLIWYTQGKGDQDFGIADSSVISKPAVQGSASYGFTAPHRPYTMQGKLLQLCWAVEVVSFPSHQTQKQELTISPNRAAIQLKP